MKKVLISLITLCLLMGVFTCVVSAEAIITVCDVVVSERICPGKVLDIDAPEVIGSAVSTGWEIQTVDGVWVPYDGQPLDESDDGKQVRYFAADEAGEYAYSGNTCTLVIEHKPQGAYEYSGTDHWRICAECGGKTDEGHHTTLGSDALAANKVCQVCGQVRTPQYNGLLGFWEWLLNVVLAMFM